MALTENLQDPFPNFMFEISCDGLDLAAFTKVSGLGAEVQHFEYDELGSGVSLKFPEKVKYGDVVLEKGQISELGLFAMLDLTIDAVLGTKEKNLSRVNLEITQKNLQGSLARTWVVQRASVKKWNLSAFDSMNATFSVESLVLTHHGIEVKK